MLTLVHGRGEIVQNTDLLARETHVVPQLLTMVGYQFLYRFTLYENIILYYEINKVFMLNGFAMIRNSEIILALVGNLIFV